MITAAVVGLGNIGLRYDLECPAGPTTMTHTAACLRHRDVSLSAGIDPDDRARCDFQRVAGQRAFPDLTSAGFRCGQIDLFIISTPTPVRWEIVRECAALDPRAILVEKPLADNLDDARAMVRCCRDRNIALAVNYFRRFDQTISRIGRQIGGGRFGRLCHGTCLYSGGMLNNASHYVDLVIDWFGRPVASRRITAGDGGDHARSPELFMLDVAATPRGRFARHAGSAGAHQTGAVAGAASPGEHAPVLFREVDAEYGIGELDLLFERGRVRFENYCEHITVMDSGPDPFFPAYRRLQASADSGWQADLLHYQYHVLDRLVHHLQGDADVPSTGDTALTVLETCMDVINAAASADCLA